MSMKPNYFKIGIFVIAAITLIVIAVVVFGSGMLTQEKVYLETYFDGSVSGLNIGAPVEIRGVRMGQVEKITFALKEYKMEVGSEDFFNYGNYVMVLASIDTENLPADLILKDNNSNVNQFIARGFRLRMASNILTGQAYLQGEFLDPNRYPVLEVPWKPKNFYISSAPGEFTTMKESVDKILRQLEQIDTKKIGDMVDQLLMSINKSVDDANIPELSRDMRDLVANMNRTVAEANVPAISGGIQDFVARANQAVDDINMPTVSGQIQSLLAEARQTNQYIQELLKKPEKTESQMANIAVMVDNLNRTLMRIDKLVISQSPKIEQALDDLRDVSADLKEIVIGLRQYPSQLIYSQPPPKPEVSK